MKININTTHLIYTALMTAIFAVMPAINKSNMPHDFRDAPGSANMASDIIPGKLNLQKVAIFGLFDDRKPPTDSTEVKKKLCKSTIALVLKNKLRYNKNRKLFTATSPTLQEAYQLDARERFLQEPVLATGSGVLVGNDIVLTAGHAFYPFQHDQPLYKYKDTDKQHCCPIGQEPDYQKTCRDYYYIFDYLSETNNKLKFPAENVYECDKILTQHVRHNSTNNFFCENEFCTHYTGYADRGPDYAVIKLTRKAANRDPLPISRVAVAKGTPVFTIGYPSGLPVKIADNATVKNVYPENGFFDNSLDTFAGNSGSPVFDAETLLIVGVTSRSPAGEHYYGGRALHSTSGRGAHYFINDKIYKIADSWAEATLAAEFEKYIPVTQIERDINTILERKLNRKFEKDGNGYKIVPAISFPGQAVTPEPAVFHPKPAPVMQPKNGI